MKKAYAFMTLLFCILTMNSVFASDRAANFDSSYIINRDLNSYTLNTIPTSGALPMIKTGTLNAFEINSEIDKIRADAENNARRNKAMSIEFSYRSTSGGLNNEYISLIINSTITAGSSLDKIDSIVISADTHEILNLNDVLGPNGVRLANNVIAEQLASNPDFYTNSSVTIDENHNFYIEDNILYITFDKYEIAPGSEGIQTIAMDLNKIINLTLDSSEYRLSTLYSIRMVPLRYICETFGYRISSWHESTQIATITKPGSTNAVMVRIGVNSYTRGFNRTTAFETSLEAAPEIIDNLIFVPITFTEIILDLNYSIDENGNITISEYLG